MNQCPNCDSLNINVANLSDSLKSYCIDCGEITEISAPRPRDSRGRVNVSEMNTDEMLAEIVTSMRYVGDAIEAAASNPMFRALVPGLGGK